jgi:hypothetical protein
MDDIARACAECPGCGRGLPESIPGCGKDKVPDDEKDPEDAYWVTDGQALGCGCAGGWSADEDGAWPNHNDEECLQCLTELADDLEKRNAALREQLATVTRERDEAVGHMKSSLRNCDLLIKACELAVAERDALASQVEALRARLAADYALADYAPTEPTEGG